MKDNNSFLSDNKISVKGAKNIASKILGQKNIKIISLGLS